MLGLAAADVLFCPLSCHASLLPTYAFLADSFADVGTFLLHLYTALLRKPETAAFAIQCFLNGHCVDLRFHGIAQHSAMPVLPASPIMASRVPCLPLPPAHLLKSNYAFCHV